MPPINQEAQSLGGTIPKDSRLFAPSSFYQERCTSPQGPATPPPRLNSEAESQSSLPRISRSILSERAKCHSFRPIFDCEDLLIPDFDDLSSNHCNPKQTTRRVHLRPRFSPFRPETRAPLEDPRDAAFDQRDRSTVVAQLMDESSLLFPECWDDGPTLQS